MINRAQGTVEYLVIISVVIVLSLIVVGMVITQVDNSSNVSGTASEISTKIGVNGLSLASSVASVDEKGLLVIKNIDVENLTLSKIIVDDVEHNYDVQLVAGDSKSLSLQRVSSCVGEKKNYSVKVEYVSASGLTKVADFGIIPIDCSSSVTPNGSFVSETLATGGTITYVGDYTIHTFYSSGTFTALKDLDANILVVAGGGGSSGFGSGGGGAGGLIYQPLYSVSAGDYLITVGAGGAKGGQSTGDYLGRSGGNSSFENLFTAIGGGTSGYDWGPNGFYGGSGGGAGTWASAVGVGGLGEPGQGNNGGAQDGQYFYAAGGGGAGGVGQDGTTNVDRGGDGGVGLEFPQFASVGGYPAGWFAGGGGGGIRNYGNTFLGGNGGLGGGGRGSDWNMENNTAGVANTGGGGGGSQGYYNVASLGSDGGSGIVIVSYSN